MEAIINELAKVFKAVYVDPKPENGELTDVYFKKMATKMVEQVPERVVPIIKAYDSISKEIHYFDKHFQ